MDSPPGMSFSKYAQHRGCSTTAVSRAVRRGRLRECIARDAAGKAWIADVRLADQEWAASQDLTTAPADVRDLIEASDARAAVVPRASEVPDEDEESEGPPDTEDDESRPITEGMTMAQASAAEKVWKAKLARLEYRRKAGELVEAEEIEVRLVGVFTTCRTKLLGLPTRIRHRLPHLTTEDVLVVDGLVREVLEDLSEGKVVQR